MGQSFMSVFAAFVNGLVTENPGVTGLAEVEVEWLNEFHKQLISAWMWASFQGCGISARLVRKGDQRELW